MILLTTNKHNNKAALRKKNYSPQNPLGSCYKWAIGELCEFIIIYCPVAHSISVRAAGVGYNCYVVRQSRQQDCQKGRSWQAGSVHPFVCVSSVLMYLMLYHMNMRTGGGRRTGGGSMRNMGLYLTIPHPYLTYSLQKITIPGRPQSGESR